MATAGAEGRVVTSRIVVFGAAGAGTTTTLETIWRRLRADQRGQIVRQTLAADKTAGYEVLPVDLGQVAGLHRRFQLATVPRGAANVGSRRQLLKGVDGVLFVADSAPDRLKETARAMQELSEHMSAYGRALQVLPLVLLLNKRDRPDAVPPDDLLRPLVERLGGRQPPVFEGVATDGRGVLNALSAIARLVVAPAAAGEAEPARAPADPAPTAPGSARPAAAPSVTLGPPRSTADGLVVPLVVRDGRGERRFTLTLVLAPEKGGPGAAS
jgi:signal recognition particle receptor subunit beta